MVDSAQIRRALEIGPTSPVPDRTIDITTIGAKSGEPRRIEIWFWHIDGRWFLTGTPGKRAWFANIAAKPAITFHLKNGVQADLAARAVPVSADAGRDDILGKIVAELSRPDSPARLGAPPILQNWLDESPLAEILFDELPADR